VRARSRAADADRRAADARRDIVVQTIQTQIDSARAILEGAIAVTQNTPLALEAARNAEKQATARYRAGLATVIEVAEAERLLAQAEIDQAQAQLAVWSAKLLLARAIGDLEPFLAEQRR
jgi:outer membrane protein TolC